MAFKLSKNQKEMLNNQIYSNLKKLNTSSSANDLNFFKYSNLQDFYNTIEHAMKDDFFPSNDNERPINDYIKTLHDISELAKKLRIKLSRLKPSTEQLIGGAISFNIGPPYLSEKRKIGEAEIDMLYVSSNVTIEVIEDHSIMLADYYKKDSGRKYDYLIRILAILYPMPGNITLSETSPFVNYLAIVLNISNGNAYQRARKSNWFKTYSRQ